MSFKRTGLRYLRLAVLGLVLGAQGANACAFHTYAPDPTVVDLMLGSERVVLARPDPSGDGLRVVRELVGPRVDEAIDVQIDFPTLGRLAANPGDAVILARGYDYGPWEMIGYAQPDLQTVLGQVVPYLPDWMVGGDDVRLQMFADLMDHPNLSVRTLALLELDRADYSLLRALDLPSAPAVEALTTGDEALRPVRILLSGLSGDAETAALVADELQANIGSGLAYLGAYAIALLELRGPDAAQAMAGAYLRDATLPVETREKLLEAFAIQARAGEPEVGAAVQRITSDVLADAPELAPAVARQFGFQNDWSQSDALARVVASHEFADIADVFALNQYIALAMEYGSQ